MVNEVVFTVDGTEVKVSKRAADAMVTVVPKPERRAFCEKYCKGGAAEDPSRFPSRDATVFGKVEHYYFS